MAIELVILFSFCAMYNLVYFKFSVCFPFQYFKPDLFLHWYAYGNFYKKMVLYGVSMQKKEVAIVTLSWETAAIAFMTVT